MRRQTGTYEPSIVDGCEVRAFVPFALPPANPPLDLDGLAPLLIRAHEQLRLLQLAGELVPSVGWFIDALVRKEAVLSAQIEGMQVTLMDLFEVEASPGALIDDEIKEVLGYVTASSFAWAQLGLATGLPISRRLLSETHRRLREGAAGRHEQPGQVRGSQHWIGGIRGATPDFVPPPPHRLPALLDAFEHAVHAHSDLPPLVRIGLLHAQFETLHPYLQGNSCLGRLLITLLLRHFGLLSRPLLCISLFFKENRPNYDGCLRGVRTDGDWEGWLEYFLEAVAVVAEQVVATAQRLHTIVGASRQRLLARKDASVFSLRLFELLTQHPIVTVKRTKELMNCSRDAAVKSLRVLEAAGILEVLHAQKRIPTLAFKAYLARIREGTELVGE